MTTKNEGFSRTSWSIRLQPWTLSNVDKFEQQNNYHNKRLTANRRQRWKTWGEPETYIVHRISTFVLCLCNCRHFSGLCWLGIILFPAFVYFAVKCIHSLCVFVGCPRFILWPLSLPLTTYIEILGGRSWQSCRCPVSFEYIPQEYPSHLYHVKKVFPFVVI